MKRLGSKLGALWSASTAPVRGSMAMTPPWSESANTETTNFCRSRSMFVYSGGAPSGLRSCRAPASRTTRPRASTSTNRVPSLPRNSVSYCFSSPPFPICWPDL